MELYTRLVPVLPVRGVRSERAFYEALGFACYADPKEPYAEDAFAAF